MFVKNNTSNQKDEMLRQAFLKIKQENQSLNEKIIVLEKRLEALEQQKIIIPKKAEITNSDIVVKQIETAKSLLTPSEKEILHLFTMSKDKKYTYEEIAIQLGKSGHTVKAQIQSIIRKGIPLVFVQLGNSQRAYYLENQTFELIIKTA